MHFSVSGHVTLGVLRWRHELDYICPLWVLSKFGPIEAYMCAVIANWFFPSNGIKRYFNGPLNAYKLTKNTSTSYFFWFATNTVTHEVLLSHTLINVWGMTIEVNICVPLCKTTSQNCHTCIFASILILPEILLLNHLSLCAKDQVRASQASHILFRNQERFTKTIVQLSETSVAASSIAVCWFKEHKSRLNGLAAC